MLNWLYEEDSEYEFDGPSVNRWERTKSRNSLQYHYDLPYHMRDLDVNVSYEHGKVTVEVYLSGDRLFLKKSRPASNTGMIYGALARLLREYEHLFSEMSEECADMCFADFVTLCLGGDSREVKSSKRTVKYIFGKIEETLDTFFEEIR